MKGREAGEDLSIIRFVERVYKASSFWYGALRTRLSGVSNESWGLAVFEKGIVRELII